MGGSVSRGRMGGGRRRRGRGRSTGDVNPLVTRSGGGGGDVCSGNSLGAADMCG